MTVIDVEHINKQISWSRETFGPSMRTKSVVDHIKKELEEILADPTDLNEWVDVIILAFDGAWRSGHSAEEIITAIKAKQEKNQNRVWPDWRNASEGSVIEHDRSYDE
jgi:hypothetical protein